ncbi:BTB/POZ protein [Pelagophyceae sp. CCMP2097]|nr:BTB/POZ protein [Pelagophyceae sp. CCMP2097]|mmetsp:Transcript_27869/g.93754  ORF Transcript_27869/g.93754 Transcript_27869/m.93754 type:complete len:299 (-) Transcript_27869:29-925(-)
MFGASERGSRSRSHFEAMDQEHESKLELEHAVLEQRSQELRREARKQARQRAFLREERKKAREERESLEADKAALKHKKKEDWFPEPYLPAGSPRLRLNVGGQVFEISRQFLDDDPDSLLAALSSDDCPLFKDGSSDGERVAYVDRDWWLFRYILIFLRDGVLPQSRALTLQLYREAAFWRLRTLQTAIEETHLQLTRTKIGVDSDPASKTFGALVEEQAAPKTKFWLNRPDWWESQAKTAPPKEDPDTDWWTDKEDYKSTRFGPLSTNPIKVVANKEEVKKNKDVYPMVQSTWGYRS